MSAESISANVKAQLQHEIVETSENERKLVDKLKIVKFFLENAVFYIGKKEHLIDLTFFLGTKVAKSQNKEPLEYELYMDLFQDLFVKNCDEFVSVTSYRVIFLKAVRSILKYRLIRKKLKVDFLKMYLTTADKLFKGGKEMFEFCLDMLEFLILNSNSRNFKTESLDFVFERFKSSLLEDVAENKKKLVSRNLLPKLLVWGKSFELDVLCESGSRDERWHRRGLAGSESWRQNASKVIQTLMLRKVLTAQLEQRDKQEFVDIQFISALSDVVNLDIEESTKIEELYGSWLWECSLISNELIDPTTAVEALVERILADDCLDIDAKCQTLYCLLVALYKSNEASTWRGEFEPSLKLRASFKKIVAFVEFSDVPNTKNDNMDEEDDSLFLNQVKLELITVIMLLDGHAVSKFMVPATTVALKTNKPDFILASIRHYLTSQRLSKYFRSYFVESLRQVVHTDLNEQIFVKIGTLLVTYCDSLDLGLSLDLVVIILDAFRITGCDVNVKNVNITLQLSKVFLGLIREESLSFVDQNKDKLHGIIEKISNIELNSQLMNYMVPLLNLLYLVCSMLKPSDLAVKVTELIKAADNCMSLSGKEAEKSLFEEFSMLALETTDKERTRKTNELVKRVLTSDWSSHVEFFLKHPQVFSDSKIQNLIVKNLEDLKSDCLVQKNSDTILSLLNFDIMNENQLLLMLANGQARAELASMVLRLINLNKKAPVSEMEPIVELIFSLAKEKPQKLNQAFGKALNAIITAEESEMCDQISRILSFLTNGLKKCGDKNNYEAHRVAISLILLKMPKIETLERSKWMPKKCEKYIRKISEGVTFDENSEAEIDILALTYKTTILNVEEFDDSNLLQICVKLASSSEISFVHQQLLMLLFQQHLKQRDSAEDSNIEKLLQIFASLAAHESCRNLVNTLVSKIRKDRSKVVDLCFRKFAAEALKTNTILNEKTEDKSGKERLASLLEKFISKFGKLLGYDFYERMAARFSAEYRFASGEAKALWLRCLLATARQGSFFLNSSQAQLVILCLGGKPTSNSSIDKTILDFEMVLMHNILHEILKDITVPVFTITLCSMLKILFSLSSTSIKSISKSVNRKRKRDEVKQMLKKEQKSELQQDDDDYEQDSSLLNPEVFVYEDNQLTSDQLEKSIATFRKIVHSLNLLPDLGKWVHAHLIGVGLFSYRHLSLKVDLLNHFSELMKFMVDSVKNSIQLKLVLNNADNCDLSVLDQFQVK